MSKIASKSEAVSIIRRAVAAGFTRTVEPLRLGTSRPFAVQVNLFHLGDALRPARQIIVSFRRSGKRQSVAIASGRIYSSGASPKRRGPWDANYLLANP